MYSASDLAAIFLHPHALLTLVAGVAVLVLALVVASSERGSRESVALYVVAVPVSIWLFGAAGMRISMSPASALWWAHVAYLGVPFIPAAIYHFTTVILRVEADRTPARWLGWLFGGLFCALAVGTDALIAGISRQWWGFHHHFGPLVFPMLLFFAGFLGLSLHELVRRYRTTRSETERLRMKWLIIAFSTAYLAGADFLAGMGVVLYPAGYLAVLACTAIAARTILKYRLVELTPSFAAEQILATMVDPLVVCDTQGVIRIANHAACEIFARSREELLGASVELLAGDDAERGRRLRYLVAEGSARDEETVLASSTGEEISVSISVAQLPEVDGCPSGSVLIAHDLRARKRAARELVESEERFRQLADALPQLFWMGDVATGELLYLSPAYERIWGRAREELLRGGPLAWLDTVHPEDRERVRKAVAGQRLGGVAQEYRIVRPEGGIRWILENLFPVRDAQGQVYRIVGLAEDVTERKRMEEALRRSEEHYRLMVEGSELVFFYIHDNEGRFEYVSPSVQAVLGFAPDELTGEHFSRLLTGDPINAELLDQTESALRSGEGRATYVAVNRRKDGKPVTLEITETPIVRDGEVLGMQGFARDISERRALEAQYRQAQKMEAVGRLAGGVAHDFNNILTALGGNAEFLLENLCEDDPRRADVLEIRRGVERAAKLTRQLLAFSRKQVLQPRALDLNEVLAEIRSMLHRLIGEDVELVLEPESQLRHVKVDRGQMEQVIVNLVVNARDAMPHGGRLVIATANAEITAPDHARSPGMHPGSYVLIAVSDTGTGIPRELQAHIFEPFFTTKEQGKGTGLGLATVYGIVKQSGGFVYADSEPGVGTTLRIYLPRVESEAAAAPPEPRVVPSAAPVGETILVVEDEPGVRMLAKRVLARCGYKVLTAHNGGEAIVLSERYEEPIHLLLTDVVMPGMSGRELADHLAHGRPEMRVLFMSGYSQDAISHRGVLDHGIAFLQKPFTPQELVERVREVLAAVPA